jgi:hypothetical protein
MGPTCTIGKFLPTAQLVQIRAHPLAHIELLLLPFWTHLLKQA